MVLFGFVCLFVCWFLFVCLLVWLVAGGFVWFLFIDIDMFCCLLVDWLVSRVWLVGWLVGRSVGWLVG